MITNLTIEHRIARENLGESNDDFAQQYVNALTDALQSEYPEAEITVNLKSDFANCCQTLVNGRADEDNEDFVGEISENVGVIANLIWDRM